MKIKKLLTPVCCSLLIAATCVQQSCSEKIDDSALYTFVGEMMIDHFTNDTATYSDYLVLLDQVHPSKKSPSTMRALLAARGNYTCFAPTNEAIRHHLDSLLVIGEVSSTDIHQVPDSVAESIVFNSIIENGDNPAFATTDFVEGALTTTNMNDRYVNISYGNDSTGATLIFVNTNSIIIEKDIEVENGYIHTIDKVLSPSTATLADLIETTENLTFFGDLLKLTGLESKLLAYKDYDYEDNEKAGAIGTNVNGGSGWNGTFPEHRYFGFTAFVETDSVFAEKGINNIEDLKNYIKENAYYDENTSYGDDYYDPNNAIYQFVAYHLLPERLIWNRLVIYSNEKGFYSGSPNDGTKFGVNVWEYYETMDPNRRSIKITGIRNGKKINRLSRYNMLSYREISPAPIEGVNIQANNGQYDNNAMNGYYYPIDDILLWTEDVPTRVLNERMRYDVSSLLPEMMTNNHRHHRTQAWYYTPDYFTSKNGGSGAIPIMSEETDFAYLSNYQNEGSQGTWTNFQMDEFNIRGIYDFVLRLPPVPYTGTYEIRYGVNANNNRGMGQIYIGTNPNNLPAVGIPIDLRLTGSSSMINWASDSSLGTDEAIEDKDKAMRHNGYMKGPKYFYPANNVSGRDCEICLRKVIFTGQLEAGKTYYVRFKSVLESSSTQFFFDYLEFVPKSVYNGDEPEDKW